MAAPVGILLAAGRGSRFDPSGERKKLLQALPGSGDAVVAASAAHLLAVLPRVVAVLRPGDDDIAALLHALGCEVTVCVDAGDGMAASLAHGLRASMPQAAGWIVALGDMPYVAPSTIAAMAAALQAGAVLCAPEFGGRRGNPAGFGAALLPELLALRGDQGARSLFERHPYTAIASSDAGILRDIDHPADL